MTIYTLALARAPPSTKDTNPGGLGGCKHLGHYSTPAVTKYVVPSCNEVQCFHQSRHLLGIVLQGEQVAVHLLHPASVGVLPLLDRGADCRPSCTNLVVKNNLAARTRCLLEWEKIVVRKARPTIRSSQHGFMAGRSTATNLLVYMEALTKLMDESHAVDVLAKAFNKVPHRRLLEKCRGLGLDGKVLEWIRVWLEGRNREWSQRGGI